MPIRAKKFTAPEPLAPRRVLASKQALADAFNASRERNIVFTHDTDKPLRARTVDHPAFGPLAVYQWFLLVASHPDRHINQMREVMTDPSLPKK